MNSAKTSNITSKNQLNNKVDLLHYLRLLMRRKWWILLFAILVTSLAAYIVSQLSPIYRATNTLLIEEDKGAVLSVQDVFSQSSYDKSYFLTQFEILKSVDLAEKVVQRLDLESHPVFDPRQQPPSFTDSLLAPIKEKFFPQDEQVLPPASTETSVDDLSLDENLEDILAEDTELELSAAEDDIAYKVMLNFRRGLSVTSVRGTQIVKISFESIDPEMSALIANTMADVYIESDLQANLDTTQKATSWLTGQLDDLRENLKKSELALQRYRENSGLVDVDGVKTLDSRELTVLTNRYVEAKGQRYEAETIYSQVKQLGSNPSLEQLMGIPSVLRQPLVQKLKQEQAKADQKVAELNQLLGPKHPDMIAAISEAQASENALRQQVLRVIDGVEADYQLARKTESSLSAQIDQSKKRFQNINRQEFKLKELEREVETNRQMYDVFFKRAKETDQVGGIQKAHARIIDEAKIPRSPIKPNKKLFVLMAFVASFVIAISFFLFLDIFDNAFHTIDDVEDQLQANVFAKVPYVKNGKKVIRPGSGSGAGDDFDESMRTLRTSFVISSLDQPFRITLVTSSVPDEGKSTISSNLSFALSQMEKTLIIDADLRKATLAKCFGLELEGMGLSDLLSPEFKIKKAIHPISDSLHILPAGHVCKKPLEVLSSDKMQKTLQILSKEYDRIIIDSPPVVAVSDSMVLAKYVDSIVYVVKADSTKPNVVTRGVKLFERADKQVDGIVLNCVNQATEKYYGGYDVGYGYGYS